MTLAFRPFYDTHVRFVWRSLLRIGVDESDVADAVQDAFVIVHKKLPEFEGRSKPTTWLFAICIRVASDRRHLARHRHEVPSTGDPQEATQDDTDQSALLDRRRARAVLDRILDRMPEEQRIVFCLFELEELSGDEIAELLDVPVGTVRSRLRLARETFRACVARLEARDRGSTGAFFKAAEV